MELPMKTVLSMMALVAMPSMAWAHSGHNGIGLFHHLQDLLPIVAAIFIVAAYMLWKKHR
ncbi:hypothetical protein KT99_11098 [Shewanella benthica KT99]|uniref:Uncharacterized protein n=2 Tax=Shewanella benthica TaxID=43661 RepID=A9DC57_9GAMM|nr:hypothetical protein KT99_11098 [Shewanella benthica KT99]